jgi:hypothetical protein
MAGQKVIRQQIANIEKGGVDREEEILTWWCAGDTIDDIVKRLGICKRSLYNWISKTPEREQMWQAAKRMRAVSFADQALTIADDPKMVGPDDIQRANLRVKVRRWMAACLDPNTFGSKPDTVINVGELHLTAVAQINAEDTKRRLQLKKAKEAHADDPVDADFRLESDDEEITEDSEEIIIEDLL